MATETPSSALQPPYQPSLEEALEPAPNFFEKANTSTPEPDILGFRLRLFTSWGGSGLGSLLGGGVMSRFQERLTLTRIAGITMLAGNSVVTNGGVAVS